MNQIEDIICSEGLTRMFKTGLSLTPNSALCELVDNSVDARASEIRIIIREGIVAIKDNGYGIVDADGNSNLRILHRHFFSTKLGINTIGNFGTGMKAAKDYLGEKTHFISKGDYTKTIRGVLSPYVPYNEVPVNIIELVEELFGSLSVNDTYIIIEGVTKSYDIEKLRAYISHAYARVIHDQTVQIYLNEKDIAPSDFIHMNSEENEHWYSIYCIDKKKKLYAVIDNKVPSTNNKLLWSQIEIYKVLDELTSASYIKKPIKNFVRKNTEKYKDKLKEEKGLIGKRTILRVPNIREYDYKGDLIIKENPRVKSVKTKENDHDNDYENNDNNDNNDDNDDDDDDDDDDDYDDDIPKTGFVFEVENRVSGVGSIPHNGGISTSKLVPIYRDRMSVNFKSTNEHIDTNVNKSLLKNELEKNFKDKYLFAITAKLIAEVHGKIAKKDSLNPKPATIQQNEPEIVQEQNEAEIVQEQNEPEIVQEQNEAEIVQEQNEAEIVQEQNEAEIVQEQNELEIVQEQNELEIVQEQNEAEIVQEQNEAEIVQINRPPTIVRTHLRGISSLSDLRKIVNTFIIDMKDIPDDEEHEDMTRLINLFDKVTSEVNSRYYTCY